MRVLDQIIESSNGSPYRTKKRTTRVRKRHDFIHSSIRTDEVKGTWELSNMNVGGSQDNSMVMLSHDQNITEAAFNSNE